MGTFRIGNQVLVKKSKAIKPLSLNIVTPNVARSPVSAGAARDSSLIDRGLLSLKTVAVVGVGALGSWITRNLAEYGVGEFRLMDSDAVEKENLGGRTAYADRHLGMQKVYAISDVLKSINPRVRLKTDTRKIGMLGANERYVFFHGADIALLTFDDANDLIRIADFTYSRVPTVFPGMGRAGERGFVSFACFPVTPCLRCTLRVDDGLSMRRLRGEPSLPVDIQKVALEASRACLSLLCRVDQLQSPAAGWINISRNFLRISNRGSSQDIEWEASTRRSQCQTCQT